MLDSIYHITKELLKNCIFGLKTSRFFHLLHKKDTNKFRHTVKLWSLELACLEHQGLFELVRWSLQFPYTYNVKIHPKAPTAMARTLELKARSAGRFFL